MSGQRNCSSSVVRVQPAGGVPGPGKADPLACFDSVWKNIPRARLEHLLELACKATGADRAGVVLVSEEGGLAGHLGVSVPGDDGPGSVPPDEVGELLHRVASADRAAAGPG